MIENLLLKYLLNKNIYNKYYKYIKITNKELIKIYYIIKTLQETSNKEVSSISDLELTFYTEYPFLRPTEKEAYALIFKKLQDLETPEEKLHDYLEKQRETSSAETIATLALEVSQGTKSFQELLDHVQSVDIDVAVSKEPFVSNKLTELYRDQIALPGLRWRLACLNHSLGSLRQGDFGFIFARPETGKTTFLASEVTYMAEQVQTPILWFNNEEGGKKVSFRCIQASLGLTQAQLAAALEENEVKYLTKTKDKLKIVDDATIHKWDIEQMCKEYKPSLIIFDQIDKIKGFDGDRPDLVLGACYQWARELAKTYAPVIGVSQADGSADGIKFLNMGHVANAKTAKQAEADWILGIGKSFAEEEYYQRYLSISKNKLIGDTDTNPNMRHGNMTCLIHPEIARYGDQI